MKRLNQTQLKLLTLIINRFGGNGSKGYIFGITQDDKPYMGLNRLNLINQAYTLEEKYPNIFKTVTKAWRNVSLILLDDNAARQLEKDNT